VAQRELFFLRVLALAGYRMWARLRGVQWGMQYLIKSDENTYRNIAF
jgi:hypothetical protein